MTLYFFSGLGADERAFEKIVIPERWKVVHIKWFEPQKDDTLSTYCYKIGEQIKKHKDYSFIGLSFGGVVAVELSKILTPKHLILISSVSNRKELSFEYKCLRKIKLYRIIPKRLFILPHLLLIGFLE